MANSVVLSNGTTSVDLTGDVLPLGSSFDYQADAGGPGVGLFLAIRARQVGSGQDNLWQKVNTIERLLTEAKAFRARTLGRRVTLTVQLDGATLATTWDVLSGEIAERPDPFGLLPARRNRYEAFTLLLEVEPFGRSTESTVFSTGTLYGTNVGLTHRFVHHTGGTVFSSNMAAVTAGSFWKSDKFSTSTTDRTPAGSDALYFGNSLATFDRLILGLSVAGSGITYTGWQYWNGSTWAGFSPTNPFASGGNPFGTLSRLNAITWTSLSGWATTAVNGVTAYWIRLLVSSVSSPTAPRYINGPIRSLVGLRAVASTDVLGDVAAKARVHVTNPGATALGGVRAALAEGLLTDQPPPFVIECQGIAASDEFITSGDSTASVQTDTNASLGERVDVSLAASLSDRAQTLNGTSEYISVTPTAADKLATLGAGSFFAEIVFKADVIGSDPIDLLSQWSGTLSTSSWWLGIDQGKLRAVVSNASQARRSVNGSTTIQAGEWAMATLEFDASAKQIRLYLNSELEGSNGVGSATLRNGQTTALRIGRAVGWSTSDSRSGSDDHGYLDGSVGHVYIYGNTVAHWIANASLEGDDYNFPNGDEGADEGQRPDGANVRWLLQMEDNAANTTIVDSAATYAAAQNAARSAGNTNANTVPGILQGGVGAFQRILGIRLPQTFGEEYGGQYRLLLAAAPATALTALEDVQFALQLSVGSTDLGFVASGRTFPSTAAPLGFYLIDFGPVTLPPVGLYEGHRGSGSATNALLANIYIQHQFVAATTVRLDCLYLLPLGAFYGAYDTFRTDYDAAYAIAQNEGLAWDNRALEPLVYQTTTGGAGVQDRNPFARFSLGHPHVQPRTPAWLFALGLRPDATNDVLYRGAADTLTPRLDVVPQWRALASPAA